MPVLQQHHSLGHTAADQPEDGPERHAQHRVEEQRTLEVLQQEGVEIGAPAAAEFVDGAIRQPERILLRAPPTPDS